jgi:cytochrome c-type biogenesis protein CcmI
MVIGGILLVVLVVLAVLFVVVPFLRSSGVEEWQTASAEQVRRVELRERRDAAYVALRELELDHETGKLDDRDFARANAELRAEALAALAALEADERSPVPEPPLVPQPPPVAEPPLDAPRRTDG